MLQHMARDLAVPDHRIGFLVTVWALTIAVTVIPIGALTLRVPRRTLLAGSLVVMALANVVAATAPSYSVEVAARVGGAVAHGAFWAAVVVYTSRLVPRALMGRALAVVLAGPTLAGLIGIPAVAWSAQHGAWRMVFVAFAGIFLGLAVYAALFLPQTVRHQNGKPAGLRSWDGSSPRTVAFIVSGGMAIGGHFVAYTFVTALLARPGGVEVRWVPVLLIVFGVAGFAGSSVAGWFFDWRPHSAYLWACGLLAVGVASAILPEHGMAPALVAVVLWGVSIGVLPPIFQASVLRSASEDFRDATGPLVVMGFNVGIAAGSFVASQASAGVGVGVLPWIGAVVVVVAGALHLGASTRWPRGTQRGSVTARQGRRVAAH
jgi:predicted MFS family arabinose efflux permease